MQIQVKTRHNKKYERQGAAADAENNYFSFWLGYGCFVNAASLNPSLIKL